MNKEDFAKLINNRPSPLVLSEEEKAIAKESGLLIVSVKNVSTISIEGLIEQDEEFDWSCNVGSVLLSLNHANNKLEVFSYSLFQPIVDQLKIDLAPILTGRFGISEYRVNRELDEKMIVCHLTSLGVNFLEVTVNADNLDDDATWEGGLTTWTVTSNVPSASFCFKTSQQYQQSVHGQWNEGVNEYENRGIVIDKNEALVAIHRF